jgi:FMN reductase
MTPSGKGTGRLVVGLGGGLGGESQSLAALKAALAACEKAGARTDLIDLQTVRLPLLEPNKPLESYSAEAKDFVARIAAADGYLWASPAYHGTISGVVKNALDFIEYLSDRRPPYLHGKPVGLISTAAGSMAAVTTIQAMQHVAHSLRAWVVPLSVPIHQAHKAIDWEGRVTDPSVMERLEMLGREVVGFLNRG